MKKYSLLLSVLSILIVLSGCSAEQPSQTATAAPTAAPTIAPTAEPTPEPTPAETEPPVTEPLCVYYGESVIPFSVEPTEENGAVLVPLEELMAVFGVTPSYSEDQTTVFILYDGYMLAFAAGGETLSKTALLAGDTELLPFSVSPRYAGEVLLVPVEDFAAACGRTCQREGNRVTIS